MGRDIHYDQSTDQSTDLLKLSKLEAVGLQLIADGMNALHYHYRKRVRRRFGRPYRLVINFQWTANGKMEIIDLLLREVRKRDG